MGKSKIGNILKPLETTDTIESVKTGDKGIMVPIKRMREPRHTSIGRIRFSTFDSNKK